MRSRDERSDGLLWVSLGLALAIRVWVWLALARKDFFATPSLDDAVTLATAKAMASGGSLKIAWGSGLYVRILALSLRIFGNTLWPVKLVQTLTGLAVVPLLRWSLRETIGRKALGAALILYAVNPIFAIHEIRLQPVAFALVLLPIVVKTLFLKRTGGAATQILGGLALGAGFTLEPMPFACLGVAYAACSLARRASILCPSAHPAARQIGTALLGFLVVPGALLAHNSASRGVTAISVTNSTSFYRSLEAETWGTPRSTSPPMWRSSKQWLSLASEALGHEATEAEMVSFYRARALQRLIEHPLDAVWSWIRKVVLALSSHEIPDPVSTHFVISHWARSLLWSALVFPLTLGLAVLGLWTALRAGPYFPPIVLVGLLVATVLGLHSGASRLPFTLALLPFAGLGAVALWERGERRPAQAALVALAVVFSLLNIAGPGRFESPSEDLRFAAAGCAAAGNNGRALALLQQSVTADSSNAWAWAMLAGLHASELRTQTASKEYERAVKADSNCVEALIGLARAYRDDGKFEAAYRLVKRAVRMHPNHPLYLNELGALEIAMGKLAEARMHIERALVLQPNYAVAYKNLHTLSMLEEAAANLLLPQEMAPTKGTREASLADSIARLGKAQRWRAVDSLSTVALALFPKQPLFHVSAARARAALGDTAGALEHLQAANHLAPGRAGVVQPWAVILIAQGRRQEALKIVEEALRVAADETNRNALRLLRESIGR